MDFKKRISMEIKLAWRNVWKNKRRTVLTFLTIMMGCAMIILFRSMQDGGYEQMIEDAVAANTGHIQIHEKGFWENMSIDYAFKVSDSLEKVLQSKKEIFAYSKRIHAGGLLSLKETTFGALIQAIEPVNEKKIGTLHKNILKGGRFLQKGDTTEIVMGQTLAKNMEAKVGDTISMISQGLDGSIAAENLTIVGLFKTGNVEYDRMLILMTLDQAVETFSMMDYVSSITIRLKETSDMEKVRSDLRRMAKAANLETELEILGWDELLPFLVQYIIMDRVSGYVFYIILFMIVAFGVLNTVQMSVFERTREFGVMMAIGTRPGQVISMVLFESVFISLLGVILGVLLGSILSTYFSINPIDYSSMAEEMEVWNIQTYQFPAKLTAVNVITTSIITFILGVIFSISPARRASKLKPIEAIRQL